MTAGMIVCIWFVLRSSFRFLFLLIIRSLLNVPERFPIPDLVKINKRLVDPNGLKILISFYPGIETLNDVPAFIVHDSPDTGNFCDLDHLLPPQP